MKRYQIKDRSKETLKGLVKRVRIEMIEAANKVADDLLDKMQQCEHCRSWFIAKTRRKNRFCRHSCRVSNFQLKQREG